MNARQDAKNLKTSPLLEQTLHDFRELLIERWEGATDVAKREATHAGVAALKEFREVLNDEIERGLGDEPADEHSAGE